MGELLWNLVMKSSISLNCLKLFWDNICHSIIKIHLRSSSEVKTLEHNMMAGLSTSWKAVTLLNSLHWSGVLEGCGLVCAWIGLRTQRWNPLDPFDCCHFPSCPCPLGHISNSSVNIHSLLALIIHQYVGPTPPPDTGSYPISLPISLSIPISSMNINSRVAVMIHSSKWFVF